MPAEQLVGRARAAVARAVKQARSDRGWTQQQLADRLEELGLAIGRVGVARIETEARPVSLEEAVYLSAALDIDFADVLPRRSPSGQLRVGPVEPVLVQLAREVILFESALSDYGPDAAEDVEDALGALEREIERHREDLRLAMKRAARKEQGR